MFRGYSQTSENAAVQGGFDATCGIFYAGVWASSLNWDADFAPTASAASIEMDWYVGIKPVTGRITWDLGVIYYTYPNSIEAARASTTTYFELKVGGSAEIWKDGTLGVTVFYSPDYQYETGAVWTVETAFTQNLPKFGMFSPSLQRVGRLSAGSTMRPTKPSSAISTSSYWYWNAGVTLGFREKWSLDFRYWDTNPGR